MAGLSIHRDLVVAGATGAVGGAFLERLVRRRPALADRGLSFRLVGALSSRAIAFDPAGLDPVDASPRERWEPDWDGLADRIEAAGLRSPVVVDCTAATALAEAYPRLLGRGISVVSANKLAWSGPSAAYDALESAAIAGRSRLAYETTVGAALPMVATVRTVARSGDTITGVRGVLSGTLSYVLGAVNAGTAFSEAVRRAHRLGLTEAHPAEDLGGADVARKLLILLREAGWRVEPADLEVESLVPPSLEHETDPERFLDGLRAFDAPWAERAATAAAAGGSLVYLAESTPKPGAGVRVLPSDDPLGALSGEASGLELRSEQYEPLPLFLSGPGAGPAVTAAGVLADVVAISEPPAVDAWARPLAASAPPEAGR